MEVFRFGGTAGGGTGSPELSPGTQNGGNVDSELSGEM